jgi:Ca2+-binding RTX toxin-like protein
MTTLKIVNTSQISTANLQIAQTEAMERFAEQGSELNQDADKAGYSNRGSTSSLINDIGTSLSGGARSDLFINLQGGDDTINLWGNGFDTVYGGSGNDKIFGGVGDDRLFGGSGNDDLLGGDDNDFLSGGSGLDVLRGGKGVDELHGGTGNDLLQGGAGIDILFGGADNDFLYGDGDGTSVADSGRDTLHGGYGNDFLIGGAKSDTLWGNAGADTFIFETATDLGLGHTDAIKDFSRAQGDKIDLSGIDANTRIAGNQAFTFVNGPSDRAGDLWLGTADDGSQRVFMNLDGVRTSLNPMQADLDLIVEFNDAAMTSLARGDFIL